MVVEEINDIKPFWDVEKEFLELKGTIDQYIRETEIFTPRDIFTKIYKGRLDKYGLEKRIEIYLEALKKQGLVESFEEGKYYYRKTNLAKLLLPV